MFKSKTRRRKQWQPQSLGKTRKSNKSNSQSSTYFNQDYLCMFILCIGMLVYFLLVYLYFSGTIVILETHIKYPYLIQNDLPLKFSIDTKTFNLSSDIFNSYINWLKEPSSLCWNEENSNKEGSVIILSVFDSDVYYREFRILIRNNRMLYAFIQNYTYCELSFNNIGADIINSFKINSIETEDRLYKKKWYKIYFINYLLNNYYKNIQSFVWIDVDAVILNFDASLNEWFYSEPTKSFFIGVDKFGPNSGVFLWKNTNFTKNVFLPYLLGDEMIKLAKKNNRGEQLAIWKYKTQFYSNWTANCDIFADLQILQYKELYNGAYYGANLPLVFHFCYEEDRPKRYITIECTMLLSQPSWLTDLIYGEKDNLLVYEYCKKNKW